MATKDARSFDRAAPLARKSPRSDQKRAKRPAVAGPFAASRSNADKSASSPAPSAFGWGGTGGLSVAAWFAIAGAGLAAATLALWPRQLPSTPSNPGEPKGVTPSSPAVKILPSTAAPAVKTLPSNAWLAVKTLPSTAAPAVKTLPSNAGLAVKTLPSTAAPPVKTLANIASPARRKKLLVKKVLVKEEDLINYSPKSEVYIAVETPGVKTNFKGLELESDMFVCEAGLNYTCELTDYGRMKISAYLNDKFELALSKGIVDLKIYEPQLCISRGDIDPIPGQSQKLTNLAWISCARQFINSFFSARYEVDVLGFYSLQQEDVLEEMGQ